MKRVLSVILAVGIAVSALLLPTAAFAKKDVAIVDVTVNGNLYEYGHPAVGDPVQQPQLTLQTAKSNKKEYPADEAVTLKDIYYTKGDCGFEAYYANDDEGWYLGGYVGTHQWYDNPRNTDERFFGKYALVAVLQAKDGFCFDNDISLRKDAYRNAVYKKLDDRTIAFCFPVTSSAEWEENRLHYTIFSDTEVSVRAPVTFGNDIDGFDPYDRHPKDTFCDEQLEVPTSVDILGRQYTVTTLEPSAFEGCEFTGITLPATIRAIGRNAFKNCSKLKKITLPAALASFGKDVFFRCTALKSIRMEQGNPTYEVKGGALYNKKKHRLIAYPAGRQSTAFKTEKGTESIAANAFAGNPYLKEVTLTNSVKRLGSGAFNGCTALESVKLSSKMTALLSAAFYGCTALKTISLPKGMTYIGRRAFYQCKALEKIAFPKTLKTVGTGAFCECVSLKEAILPDSLTKLGSEAFRYCKALSEVRLSASLTAIETAAFRDCHHLKKITIPKKVKVLRNGAFEDCKSLKTVTFRKGSKLKSIKPYALGLCSDYKKVGTLVRYYDKNVKTAVEYYNTRVREDDYLGYQRCLRLKKLK